MSRGSFRTGCSASRENSRYDCSYFVILAKVKVKLAESRMSREDVRRIKSVVEDSATQILPMLIS